LIEMPIVDFPNWTGLVIAEKTLSKMEDLNLNDDLSFDDWFSLFQDKARMLGHNGPLDKYSYE